MFPFSYYSSYLQENRVVQEMGDILPTAVEKAVSELPAECQFCSQKYSRNSLERHELDLCEER